MPPDIYQPAEVSSPPRKKKKMDERLDLVLGDAPVPNKDPIGVARLGHMFQLQQEKLKATLQEELNKRFPLPATEETNKKPSTQMVGFWNWNQSRARKPETPSPREIIDHLAQQNLQLHREKDSLQSKITADQQQIEKLDAYVNAANGDLSHERAKNERLGERMASLRQMLVPPPNDQVSDDEVVQKFSALRSQIFRLVKMTWAKGLRDHIEERNLSDEQRAYLQTIFSGHTQWNRFYPRLHCHVFRYLASATFGRRHYGLTNEANGLDQRLEEVETYMWNYLPGESLNVLMDWRIATMKVTERFRDDKRSLSRIIQNDIWNSLSIFETNGPDAENRGIQMLEQICNDAVDLSMLMRKAKDHLYIDDMSGFVGKPMSECESVVDEEASEAVGSTGHKTNTIAYVLTGALMKNPRDNPQETKVLEKAQVAVYE